MIWTVRRVKKYGAAGVKKVIAVALALLAFLGSTFVFNGAAGYFGYGVGEKLSLSANDPTVDELYAACDYLVNRINGAVEKGPIFSNVSGATVMKQSIGETAFKIESCYGSFSDRYGFPQSFTSIPKILVTSPLMTYTHISGISRTTPPRST